MMTMGTLFAFDLNVDGRGVLLLSDIRFVLVDLTSVEIPLLVSGRSRLGLRFWLRLNFRY